MKISIQGGVAGNVGSKCQTGLNARHAAEYPPGEHVFLEAGCIAAKWAPGSIRQVHGMCRDPNELSIHRAAVYRAAARSIIDRPVVGGGTPECAVSHGFRPSEIRIDGEEARQLLTEHHVYGVIVRIRAVTRQ